MEDNSINQQSDSTDTLTRDEPQDEPQDDAQDQQVDSTYHGNTTETFQNGATENMDQEFPETRPPIISGSALRNILDDMIRRASGGRLGETETNNNQLGHEQVVDGMIQRPPYSFFNHPAIDDSDFESSESESESANGDTYQTTIGNLFHAGIDNEAMNTLTEVVSNARFRISDMDAIGSYSNLVASFASMRENLRATLSDQARRYSDSLRSSPAPSTVVTAEANQSVPSTANSEGSDAESEYEYNDFDRMGRFLFGSDYPGVLYDSGNEDQPDSPHIGSDNDSEARSIETLNTEIVTEAVGTRRIRRAYNTRRSRNGIERHSHYHNHNHHSHSTEHTHRGLQEHSHSHTHMESNDNQNGISIPLNLENESEHEGTSNNKKTIVNIVDENSLRKEILNIYADKTLNERQKSKSIQKLMTGNYRRLQRDNAKYSDDEDDSRSERSQYDDIDSNNFAKDENGNSIKAASEFNVDEDDMGEDDMVVFPVDRESSWANKELNILGCKHYQRNIKLECSQCNKWYVCRFCHDDVEYHNLIRPETRNMLCMICGTAQAAKKTCKTCLKQMAIYYCDICKLWDNEPNKKIYHCDKCGICRLGEGLGIDFFHCDTCNACMSISLQNNHKCIENAIECNCPICGDFLFTSTVPAIFMPCGHAIHNTCYREYTKNSYKCPICSRSILNMAAQFRILDMEIARQELPEPYIHWRSVISCNDCYAKSNVRFHFLGLKCDSCDGYNTAQLRIIKPEEGGGGDSGLAEVAGNEADPMLRRGSLQQEENEDENEQSNGPSEGVSGDSINTNTITDNTNDNELSE
ncbi:hypothetical protein NADFUDRAFT_82660 [Nadsonia fulvescens var. elongata DSM 6958]|uniref:Zf-CHY-domain-containing protein n=1 Tax=Nadsonia fulvescens var. elongata DSM 6958 TaxID=857566 RepID=A0A1E3PJM8_9ASCO|nr:hypothetical protein NADFUDRAFT_82660 [Nadsonia fulvescens var. elongata DSM 6958]